MLPISFTPVCKIWQAYAYFKWCSGYIHWQHNTVINMSSVTRVGLYQDRSVVRCSNGTGNTDVFQYRPSLNIWYPQIYQLANDTLYPHWSMLKRSELLYVMGVMGIHTACIILVPTIKCFQSVHNPHALSIQSQHSQGHIPYSTHSYQKRIFATLSR